MGSLLRQLDRAIRGRPERGRRLRERIPPRAPRAHGARSGRYRVGPKRHPCRNGSGRSRNTGLDPLPRGQDLRSPGLLTQTLLSEGFNRSEMDSARCRGDPGRSLAFRSERQCHHHGRFRLCRRSSARPAVGLARRRADRVDRSAGPGAGLGEQTELFGAPRRSCSRMRSRPRQRASLLHLGILQPLRILRYSGTRPSPRIG